MYIKYSECTLRKVYVHLPLCILRVGVHVLFSVCTLHLVNVHYMQGMYITYSITFSVCTLIILSVHEM